MARGNTITKVQEKTQKRPEYASDVIVKLLKELDIEYIALNPGATFRGIHDSIVNYGGNKMPELVLCCHEEIAVGMAAGYAEVKGRPMAAAVHNIVGLQHATMAIYHSWLYKTPILIIGGTGPMDASKRRPYIDSVHTALVQGQLVRDYVKWDDQPVGLQSAVESVLRGFKIATTDPQGPVYLCFDVELQESRVNRNFRLPNVKRFSAPSGLACREEDLQKATEYLARAESPLILADMVGRNQTSVPALVNLAETLSAPVLDQLGRFNFPNTHPLDLTGDEEASIKEADVVLALDVRDLHGSLSRQKSHYRRETESLLREDARIINIGMADLVSRSWAADYQRLAPIDLPIVADSAVAIPQLIAACKRRVQSAERQKAIKKRFKSVKERHNKLRAKWREDAQKSWDKKPISTARLASETWEMIRDEDWVLAYGTLAGWPRKLWDWTKPYQFPGKAGGAGFGLSCALGAALAHKGTGRLCIDFQPDGDLLYTPSALWTAAHQEIPMLVVMFNNRSYYNDEGHQTEMALSRKRPVENRVHGIRLEDPETDFSTLARSFGLYGDGPVEDPRDIRKALQRAIRIVKKEHKLALVDIVTQKR